LLRSVELSRILVEIKKKKKSKVEQSFYVSIERQRFDNTFIELKSIIFWKKD
jgi:hypothetical protein